MIHIRFSNNHYGGEIDLSGTPGDLRNIGQSILELFEAQDVQVCIPANEVDPAPYDSCLNLLLIRKSDCPVKVMVAGSSLKIEGTPEKLKVFADWFNFGDSTESGYHNHFDYYEGNEWVDPASVSLIISVQ
ncbi:Imm32 family immunity protein [Nostoc sp.]|uniref:Imm32 family immunity protein n=1 Tax=Nostoc sp. TaxID=1180 RepID=UPI002FF7CA23